MGTLDQITQMKKQGMSEEGIIKNLSQQGVSPREITEALRQSQIKSAVSNVNDMGDEMQSSMMSKEEIPAPIEQEYQPQSYQQPQQEYSPQQTYQSSVYEEPARADISSTRAAILSRRRELCSIFWNRYRYSNRNCRPNIF